MLIYDFFKFSYRLDFKLIYIKVYNFVITLLRNSMLYVNFQ